MNVSDEELLENLIASERLIVQNLNLRPIPFQRGYRFIKGKSPILLSAPHAARTVRHGKVRTREQYVGSFVCNLSRFCKVYGMCTTHIIPDPNRYDSSKYKAKIKKLIDNNEIKLVMDIHGSSDHHRFDVDIGTYNYKSILGNRKIVKILKSSFKKHGFENISENFFTRIPRNTVTLFSYKLGIPSVQLEIQKSNRYPRYEKENTLRMFKALFEAIEEIKTDFVEVNNNV